MAIPSPRLGVFKGIELGGLTVKESGFKFEPEYLVDSKFEPNFFLDDDPSIRNALTKIDKWDSEVMDPTLAEPTALAKGHLA